MSSMKGWVGDDGGRGEGGGNVCMKTWIRMVMGCPLP